MRRHRRAQRPAFGMRVRGDTAKVKPQDRGKPPRLLVERVRVGARRERRDVSAQPGRGELAEGVVVGGECVAADLRIGRAFRQGEQRQQVLRAVGQRGVFARTLAQRFGNDMAHVLLAARIVAGETAPLGLFGGERRIRMKRVRTPNLGGEVTSHRRHNLVVRGAQTRVKHPTGINLAEARPQRLVEFILVAEVAIDPRPHGKPAVAAEAPAVAGVGRRHRFQGAPRHPAAGLVAVLGKEHLRDKKRGRAVVGLLLIFCRHLGKHLRPPLRQPSGCLRPCPRPNAGTE